MIGFIIVGLLILITVGVFIFSYKKETDEIRKKELKEENFEALDLNTKDTSTYRAKHTNNYVLG